MVCSTANATCSCCEILTFGRTPSPLLAVMLIEVEFADAVHDTIACEEAKNPTPIQNSLQIAEWCDSGMHKCGHLTPADRIRCAYIYLPMHVLPFCGNFCIVIG